MMLYGSDDALARNLTAFLFISLSPETKDKTVGAVTKEALILR